MLTNFRRVLEMRTVIVSLSYVHVHVVDKKMSEYDSVMIYWGTLNSEITYRNITYKRPGLLLNLNHILFVEIKIQIVVCCCCKYIL